MSEAARRLKANRKLEGRTCAWCASSFNLGEDVAVCTACSAEHHAGCWDARGGCHTEGCVNAPLKRLDSQPAPSPFGGPAPTAMPAAIPAGPPPLQPGFKRCSGCGNPVHEATEVCDFCGAILPPDGLYHGPTQPAPGANTALVLGILGLFFCGIIFGPLAISNAQKAKAAIAQNPRYSGAGQATAGMVLGIIAIAGWAVIMLARCATIGGGR